MRFRKLRIAWSIAWGILALLLVVLCVRSYWRVDYFGILRRHSVASKRGNLYLDESFAIGEGSYGINPKHFEVFGSTLFLESVAEGDFTPLGKGAVFPTWQPAVLIAAFAFIPWLPRRFSLRTLFIATTLIAVGLGLIMYASR